MLSTGYGILLKPSIQVIGAPSYFPRIWGFIKSWIDPVTASKLVILSQSEVLPTLTEYIDLGNIPTEFGGDLNFDPGMPPLIDTLIAERMSWKSVSNGTFPTGPLKWVVDVDGSPAAIAVGEANGKPRNDKFATWKNTHADTSSKSSPMD